MLAKDLIRTLDGCTPREDGRHPNNEAIINARVILEMMNDIELDADLVCLECQTSITPAGVMISWSTGFVKGNVAFIFCANDGNVSAFTSTAPPNRIIKTCGIHNFVGETPNNEPIQISISEALELIRHHIWANHITA